ncbi:MULTISPECIES: hypothetical protein [unclassified Sphingobacterium]|uniref:hypothetical protein n=1 Tax=unclassified Sphingobacterium TaxID=2609468 RepID=UPI001054027B|nr:MULTISPECIES: hypothetical protein [unclassified Sphingobacterium]MCS3556152.1 hypothetical protein [Sphingobacterium sp. JUb21]TCR08528.1 hypothetical protein EDF66_10375 [Sphingobacterium sp. JUb20]
MKKYLSEKQIIKNLQQGKAIEQWIGITQCDGYVVIKWLRIQKEKYQNFSVMYFEAYDDRNEDNADIYKLRLLNLEEPFGVIETFALINTAILYATLAYDASDLKYVCAGDIQENYEDYLAT